MDLAGDRETFIDFGPNTYCSEPVVVPRPGSDAPDDGWVLDLVYDAERERSFVAVLDGQSPQSGPLARIWFDQPIPYTFHGNFVSAGCS